MEAPSVPAPPPARPSSAAAADASAEPLYRLLVERGLVSAERLDYARRVRSKLSSPRPLLKILFELGDLSETVLRETLRRERVDVRLGTLLVELGELEPDQLAAALALQRQSDGRRRLGQILVEEHYIGAYELVEVLSYQLGFPHIEPTADELPAEIAPETLRRCAEHGLVPLRRREDGRPVVVFADPLEEADRAAAEELFGPDLVPAIATKEAVDAALRLLDRGRRAKTGASTTEAGSNGAVVAAASILEDALAERVSDVHIEPMRDRVRVRFRRDGVLVPHRDFPKEMGPALTSRFKILAEADIAEHRRHQDGRFVYESERTGASVDVRTSIYVTVHGEKIVLRLLNQHEQVLDIRDLGIAPRTLERFREDALDAPTGVLIVTGPTGSGKTTTLYSAVNYLNNVNRSIITAEDPVEYLIDGVSQCSINAKIGLTYEETLRHVVRQDPDVIVLGEIRDRFSAETAIQAALTGHKVLTTFHTEDSIGGLLRLLNMDIEAFLVSSTVVCVLAQRLLRRVCPECREPHRPTPRELRRLGWTGDAVSELALVRGRGCAACRQTGYRGRVGVFELLVLDEPVKQAILDRRTSHEIRRISIESSGLVTLLEDGIAKAARGITTYEEIRRSLPRLVPPRPLAEIRRLLGE